MLSETLSPRGVTPAILLAQVRNTAPFLFSGEVPARAPYLEFLRGLNSEASLSHREYFQLCLSAHWATVATFVPTDVDNQIRSRLWSAKESTETLSEMAHLVLESRGWNFSPVSARLVQSPRTGRKLSGHLGEWFSTAVGAYGALRKRDGDLAAQIASEILDEMKQEADLYLEFKTKKDGLSMLKTATIIAHNLGDLDRVFDAWTIEDEDPLKKAAYKAGHGSLPLFGKTLFEAGELNKAFMADENHRFFALRTPKALRRHADFLLPIGPFLDEWGAKIARHPDLAPREIAEIVQALVDGWEKLRVALGYTRALSGILDAFPGGFRALSNHLPAKTERTLKSGPLRTLCDIPRARFEAQWIARALNFKI